MPTQLAEKAMSALAAGATARVGQTLAGRWRLERLVRVDLVGASYAVTSSEGKRLGLKLLHPELARSGALRLGFLDTAQLGLLVGHRDVVHLLEDGQTKDGLVWYTLDALEGELVSELIARRPGRIPPTEALRIVHDTLEVLVTAHAHGVVHGGLRPEKLLVTDNGTVKVSGFGGAALEASAATALGLDLPAPMAAFASPEQARHGWSRADKRSDVWATGAILFSLLAGRLPREGNLGPELLARAGHGPVRSLSELGLEAPASVLHLLRKALELDEDLRFASARRMRTAVREVADDPEVSSLLRLPSLPLPVPTLPGDGHATSPAVSVAVSSPGSEHATRQFWGANAQQQPAPPRVEEPHLGGAGPTNTGLGRVGS
jgi:serine/threonine-protein kinase